MHQIELDNPIQLPVAEDRDRPTRRRTAKRLTELPALFHDGTGKPLIVDLGDGTRSGDHGDDSTAGGQGVLITGQRAVRRNLDDLLEDVPPDLEVAAMAHRIAQNLAVRRRPPVQRAEHGPGRTLPLHYRYRSDDVDIDRTVEVLAERPCPDDTEIVVRERVHARRAVVLVADVSGSMRGEKARIAAATIAALSADLSGAGAGDQFAIVAFWSDAALIKAFDSQLSAVTILDRLLKIPARGLTNVSFGLEVAQAELTRSPLRRRSILLLSDVVHNAGADPRTVAARCDELNVMLETDGEHDAALAVELARAGRGRLAPVSNHRDVAAAMNRLLGT